MNFASFALVGYPSVMKCEGMDKEWMSFFEYRVE
jgi:hypothetical protein